MCIPMYECPHVHTNTHTPTRVHMHTHKCTHMHTHTVLCHCCIFRRMRKNRSADVNKLYNSIFSQSNDVITANGQVAPLLQNKPRRVSDTIIYVPNLYVSTYHDLCACVGRCGYLGSSVCVCVVGMAVWMDVVCCRCGCLDGCCVL